MPREHTWGLDAQLLQDAHKKNSGYVLIKLFLLFFVWGILGVSIANTEIVLLKIPQWIILGYFINGIIQLVHECWHNNLFNSRVCNRIAGQLLSFIFFTLYEPPRHGHLLHHRYNRTDKDPDAYNAGSKTWDVILLYYGVLFFGVPLGIIHFNVLYPLQFYPHKKLPGHFLQLVLFIGLQTLLWSVIVRIHLFGLAWQVWLIPLLFTSPWNGMKSVADHFNNHWGGGPLHTATTVKSNRFTTYFWNGLNYHLEHHLFPGIPGYNLEKLHSPLKSLFLAKNVTIFNSYTRVWLQSIRRGPEIVEREQKFNPFNIQIKKSS